MHQPRQSVNLRFIHPLLLEGGTARRWLLGDIDDRHHPVVLVEKDVAVKDEFTGVIHERNANDDLAANREDHDVLKIGGVVWLPVDRYHLEVVDVEMERVLLCRHVADRPLLDSPQFDLRVDPIWVELLAVDLKDGVIVDVVEKDVARRRDLG